jgi:hypothetical protein
MSTIAPHQLVAIVILLAFMLVAPHANPANAQTADDLALSITPRMSKVHLGDFATFKVTLRNTGDETFTDLFVFLNTPDAIDPRDVDCPGTPQLSNGCELGDLEPGEVKRIRFTVEISHTDPSGPVTAFVLDGAFLTIDQVATPVLEVVE